MKLFDYIMRTLGLLLMIGFVLAIKYRPDDISKFTSEKGLMELNEARNDIVVLAKQLNAQIWSYGGRRSSSQSHWIYIGASVYVPECVTYNRFEQAILDLGFREKLGLRGFLCRRDVILSSITSDDSYISGYGENKHLFLCGDISFSISWKDGENKDEKKCWDNTK